MAYGIIYKLTNKLNGMPYVGKTTRDLDVRFKEHAKADSYIGRAIRKYGEENFLREVIEECETPEQLDEREIFCIAHFNCKTPNGYNQTDGGESGWKHTPKTRARMSESHTGKPLSVGHRVAISVAHMGEKNPNFGKPLSKEHRAKIGAKMSEINKGIPKSSEHCAKVSEAKRGETPYKNLSNAITEKQLTYRKLAKLMNITHQSLSRKMSGKRRFHANEIEKLVEIFGKPAEYLMARDD